MQIVFGADHGGVILKDLLLAYARQLGYKVCDMGTSSSAPVDYADVARQVGEAVQKGTAARGILICRTGIGMSIAANKLAGIRAAVAYHPEVVRLSRLHNDSNVLCFGADFITPTRARRYLKLWLETDFSGEERHRRRIKKVQSLEQSQ